MILFYKKHKNKNGTNDRKRAFYWLFKQNKNRETIERTRTLELNLKRDTSLGNGLDNPEAEDTKRKTLLICILAGGSVALLVFLGITVIIDNWNKHHREHASVYIFIFLILLHIAIILLARKGKVKTAGISLVCIYIVCTTWGSGRWGISMPAGLLTYALSITTASLVLGSGAGFAIAIMVLIIMFILGNHEIQNIQIASWKNSPIEIGDIVAYGILITFISLALYIANRELEKALIRARKSESELAKERNSLEERIAKRTKELKEKEIKEMQEIQRLAEIGKLSRGIFHDLMSPLTAVSLQIQALVDNPKKSIKETKNSVERAVRAANRMQDMLRAVDSHILQAPENKIFDIVREIKQAFDLVAYLARRFGVKITYTGLETMMFNGNAVNINRIIVNLITNAIEAFAEENQDNSLITIKTKKDENSYTLSIIDNGPGIKEKYKNIIFKNQFTTKKGGHGLGLLETKSLVENEFQGQIRFIENEPKGTIIEINLPFRKDDNEHNRNRTDNGQTKNAG